MNRSSCIIQELWFSNIEKEDIVLDIGAGIGSTCIPLAKRYRRLYAIEPLLAGRLRIEWYIRYGSK